MDLEDDTASDSSSVRLASPSNPGRNRSGSASSVSSVTSSSNSTSHATSSSSPHKRNLFQSVAKAVVISRQLGSPEGKIKVGELQPCDHDNEDCSPKDNNGGIGIVFVDGVAAKGKMGVLTLVSNGPAARDGRIKPGDMVLSIDGVALTANCGLHDIRKLALGKVGTLCKMKFERASNGEIYEVELEREGPDDSNGSKDKLELRRLRILEREWTAERSRLQADLTALQKLLLAETSQKNEKANNLRNLQRLVGSSNSIISEHLVVADTSFAKIRNKCQRQEKQLEKLTEELEMLRNSSDTHRDKSDSELSTLQRKCFELEAQNRALQDQLFHEKGALEETIASMKELHKKEIQGVEVKLQLQHEATLRELQHSLDSTSAQHHHCCLELDSTKAELKDTKERLAALSEELFKVKTDAVKQKELDKETFDRMREEMEEEKAVLKSCLEEAEANAKCAADQLDFMTVMHQRQVNSINSQQAVEEKRISESYKAKIVNLESDLSVALQRCQSIEQRSSEEVSRFKREKEASAEEFSQYRSDSEASARRLTEQVQLLHQEKSELSSSLEATRAELEALQTSTELRIETMKKQHSFALETAQNERNTMLGDMEREIEAMRRQHAETVKSLHTLKEEANAAARKAMNDASEAVVEKNKIESAFRLRESQLSKDLMEAEHQAAESESKLSQAEQMLNMLQGKLRSLETATDRANDSFEDCRTRCQQEVDEARDECQRVKNEMTQKMEGLKTAMNSAASEHAHELEMARRKHAEALKSMTISHEETLTVIKIELDKTQATVQRLNEEAQRSKKEKEGLSKDFAQYRAEAEAAARRAAEEAQRLIQEKSEIFSVLEATRRELEAAHREFEMRSDSIRKHHDVAIEDVQTEMSLTVASLEKEVENLRKQHSETVRSINAMKEEALNAAKAELERTQVLLQRSNEDIQRLRKEKEATIEEFAGFRNEIEISAKKAFEESKRVSQEKSELNSMLQSTRLEMEELQQTFDNKMKNLQKQHAAVLEDLKNDTAATVANIEKEMESLRKQHAETVRSINAMKEEAVSAVKMELEKTQQLLQRSSEDVQRLRKEKEATLEEFNSFRNDAESSTIKANEDFKRLSQEKSELNSMLQSARIEMEELQKGFEKKLQTVQKQYATALEEALSEHDSTRSELGQETENLRKQHAETIRSINAMKEEALNAAKAELERTQVLLQRSNEDNQRLRKEKEATIEEFNSFRNDAELAAKRSNEDLKKQSQEKSELNSMLQSTRLEMEELQQTFDNKMKNLQKQHAAVLEDIQSENSSAMAALSQETESLRKQHAETVRSINAMKEEAVSAVKMELEKTQQLLQRSSEDVQRLRKEKEAAVEELSQCTVDSEIATKRLNDEIKKLKQEKSELTTSLQSSKGEVDALKHQVESRTKSLKQQHLSATEAIQSDLEATIANMEQDMEYLKRTHAESVKNMQMMREESENELKLEVERTQISLQRASDENQRIKKEKEALSDEFSQYRIESEAATIKSIEDIKKLNQEKTELAAALQTVRVELELVQQSCDSRLDFLKKQHASSIEAMQSDSNATISALEKEVDGLRKQHAETVKALQSMKEEALRLAKSTMEDVSEAKSEKAKLEGSFRAREAQLVQQLGDVTEQKNSLEQQMICLRSLQEGMEARLLDSEVTLSREMRANEEYRLAAEQEILNLKRANQQLEVKLDSFSDVRKEELSKLEAEFNALQDSHRRALELVESLQNEREELRAKVIAEQRHSTKTIGEVMDQQSRDQKVLMGKMEQHNQKYQQVVAKIEAVEAENKGLKSELAAMEKDKVGLLRKFAELEGDLAASRFKEKEMLDLLEMAQLDVEEMAAKHGDVIRRMQIDYDHLQSEYDTYRRETERAAQSTVDQIERLSELASDSVRVRRLLEEKAMAEEAFKSYQADVQKTQRMMMEETSMLRKEKEQLANALKKQETLLIEASKKGDQEVTSMKRDRVTALAAIKALKEEIGFLSKRVEQSAEENMRLNQCINVLESHGDEVGDQLLRMTERNSTLQYQLQHVSEVLKESQCFVMNEQQKSAYEISALVRARSQADAVVERLLAERSEKPSRGSPLASPPSSAGSFSLRSPSMKNVSSINANSNAPVWKPVGGGSAAKSTVSSSPGLDTSKPAGMQNRSSPAHLARKRLFPNK